VTKRAWPIIIIMGWRWGDNMKKYARVWTGLSGLDMLQ
jgi:hypothetical protein